MDEKKISEMMKALGCTREEAIQVIADDEAIDHGEKLFEISAEEKKVVKAMTATGTKKRTTTTKRERKPDFEKQAIISQIADFLSDFDGFSVKIVNNEREIQLLVGENDYSITLIKHRPPKN